MLVLRNDLSGHGCFKLLSDAGGIHHYHCSEELSHCLQVQCEQRLAIFNAV